MTDGMKDAWKDNFIYGIASMIMQDAREDQRVAIATLVGIRPLYKGPSDVFQFHSFVWSAIVEVIADAYTEGSEAFDRKEFEAHTGYTERNEFLIPDRVKDELSWLNESGRRPA